MMTLDDIEKSMVKMFQRVITFEIDGKSIKRGKVLVFNIKEFHVHITLIPDRGPKKQFIIPLPFNVVVEPDCIKLDYTIDTLSRKNAATALMLRNINNKKNNRFFDTIVTCKFT